jgi:hypothetical protein
MAIGMNIEFARGLSNISKALHKSNKNYQTILKPKASKIGHSNI